MHEMKRLATQRGGRIAPQVVDALLGAERWRAVEHAGIDLGKKESQIAILTEAGELIETSKRTPTCTS